MDKEGEKTHGNQVTGIQNHDCDHNGSHSGSHVVVGAKRSEQTEESGQRKESGEYDNEEGEESTGTRIQTGHEVNDEDEEEDHRRWRPESRSVPRRPK